MSGHRKWSEIRKGATHDDRVPLRTLGELRQESGLSQQELAEELGVSQASISKIEHQDDPQVSTLMRYLDALGAHLELRAVFPDQAARVYLLTDMQAMGEGTGTSPHEARKIATQAATGS